MTLTNHASLGQDHPLSQELASLRAALSHYEVCDCHSVPYLPLTFGALSMLPTYLLYTCSDRHWRRYVPMHLSSVLKFIPLYAQSTARESARLASERNIQLEREITILRENAGSKPSLDVNQTTELTLALRRANERLSIIEASLLERTTQVANISSEKARAEATVSASHKLIENARAREEEAHVKERESSYALRKAVEERDMLDLVVKEASLLYSTHNTGPVLIKVISFSMQIS